MIDEFNISIMNALKLINKYNNIFICSHVQPDGDSLGSVLALAMAIKKYKENASVNLIKVDSIPKDFLFLPNVNMFKEQNTEQEVELFIALDSSDKERLGIGEYFLSKAKAVINIDHHITNKKFGDINIVMPSASATCEIVYKFIKHMDIDLDKDIASCLYTGINTDTGRFMYSNTTYEVHMIIAELMKIGIDTDYINRNIYQNKTIEKTKLFIEALNRLELYNGNKIAITMVTQEMLNKTNATMEDTEGIVSFIRDIDTIEVACLLKEISENEIKVSLRSKEYVDVSKIGIKFNGGGHKRAAGCTINKKLEVAKKMILDEILNSVR